MRLKNFQWYWVSNCGDIDSANNSQYGFPPEYPLSKAFLKFRVKSQDIIKSSEAISTINGSIALEALSLNKSLILVGHQSTPIGLCKDVFKVTSLVQCKKAIEQIEGGFIPDYSDFNEISEKYLFELKQSSLNDVQLLVNYLVCEYN